MFNLKKLLSVCISAAMLSAALPLVVSAEDDAVSSGVVMYENDFNAPTVQEALPPVSNEYLTFGGYDAIEYKPKFSNGALTMNPGDGAGGRTLVFDFTKGGTKDGLSEGVMYVGYDFAVRGERDSYEVCKVGVNMNSHWDGGRMIYYDYNSWSPTPSIGDWPAAPNILDSNVHRYEYIFDFASQQAFLYIDGSLSFTWTNLNSVVNNYTISLNGDCRILDNIKLSYYNTLPMEASVSEISEDKVRLSFSDGLATKSVLSNGATVKNIFTGEEFSAELVEVNDMLVDVVPENGFELGYGYKITLPIGIKGNCGGTLSDNTVEFSSAVSNGLKALNLKTLLGDTVKYSEENPAEIQSVIFEFTDDVDGEEALKNLSITDSENNNVAFEIKGNGNVGEALFRDALKGNEVYKLTLDGLSVLYELEMKTAEGKLAFIPGKLYKDDGVTEINSIDEISVGDTVVASFYVVNTSGNAVKYLSSTAMYNGRLMTGIDYKAAELASGAKEKTQFSFTVKDKTELSFSGTVWDSEKTWPLTDKIEF